MVKSKNAVEMKCRVRYQRLKFAIEIGTFANARSSRDRVNARPRGCALRRAESGCEALAGVSTEARMKRSKAIRRRVAGNASHAIRKHATVVERIISMLRRLKSRITHVHARTCKISRFYEGHGKSLFEILIIRREDSFVPFFSANSTRIFAPPSAATTMIYDANIMPLCEIVLRK